MIKVNVHPKGHGPLEAHDAVPVDCTVAELLDWLSKFPSDASVTVPTPRRRTTNYIRVITRSTT